MPAISELPDSFPLAGTEPLALVQDGQTVKAPLTRLLDAPRTPKAENARWITTTGNVGSPINTTEIVVLLGGSGGC